MEPPPLKKGKTLFSFYQSKQNSNSTTSNVVETSFSDVQSPPSMPQANKPSEFDSTVIERDPGLRLQICEYPVNQRDEVRRAHMNLGPYQPKLEYLRSSFGKQNRRFQHIWFKQFSCLEYSPSKDKGYCFSYFLFDQPNKSISRSALVDEGFNNWKRVNDGSKCVFLLHVGLASSSHSCCVISHDNLKKSS
ncbi:uncharacterized protein LOC114313903 [Camellia sinensis]|uniref:uncharacterized protein LOC114313903 n=1 Tax=Camellia sinensis TaxID=4442 RepID=UPI001035EF17|nr:uncharacterized protein LOC114313903 [Camellia sinensis]